MAEKEVKPQKKVKRPFRLAEKQKLSRELLYIFSGAVRMLQYEL